MADLARRFDANPILRPADVSPSAPGLVVECLLNPGAFRLGDQTCLLLRVAERPTPQPGFVSTLVLDPDQPGRTIEVRCATDDPKFKQTDPRLFCYDGRNYLTTLSHLRLARSDDGIHFTVDPLPTIIGQGPLETFGIEDCRVCLIDGVFHLTYTAVSELGVGVGLIRTRDWVTFDRPGMIFPPHNKDCALFPARIGDHWYALHRPSGLGIGGNFIWLARSPDLLHWGEHRCLVTTRPGLWDSQRVGAGAEPILTDAGWLHIYHAADDRSRYCLGALLLDRDDPSRVLGRSREPIMEPSVAYERTGFFGHVVFTNGHVVQGDELTIYYGAADEVSCGATFSISAILDTLA